MDNQTFMTRVLIVHNLLLTDQINKQTPRLNNIISFTTIDISIYYYLKPLLLDIVVEGDTYRNGNNQQRQPPSAIAKAG